MKKDAIIGLLRYGGVSKSDFNMVKPDIAKENHRVWKFSTLVLEVIFLIALIIAATVPDLKSYIVGYIILVPYFLFVEILLFTFVSPSSKLFKPLIYISCFVLVGVVLYQTFWASGYRNIGAYCAVIVAIAMLCIDRPYRFCSLFFISTGAFITLMFTVSFNNEPLYPDLFVGIIFGLVSIIISLYANHIRVKDIVSRYNAEQERDIDFLTGMKNSNSYNRMVSTLMDKARKVDFHFALVVFDINGLKQTNDTYGHECGDKLLLRSVALINEHFPNSIVYRIGGDEFATFLTGNDYENRKVIIATFRKRVEEIHSSSKDLKDDTSIACGYAHYNPEVDRDYVSLFSRADASMYDNKNNIKKKNKFLSENGTK